VNTYRRTSHAERHLNDVYRTMERTSEPAKETMTWLQLAKEEALKQGVIITDYQADYILWEHTLFPSANPDEIREEVAEFIRKYGKSFEPKTTGSSAWDKVNADDP
jgi:hypothetical protein